MNSLDEAINYFDEDLIGQIITWSAVSEVHKVRTGIYQKQGELISLLTDLGLINACYPDFYEDGVPQSEEIADIIFYTGAGRRGDQKLDIYNKALFDAIETRKAVPLFQKLSVGRWKYLGLWQVTDGKYVYDELQKRMIWRFELHKTNLPQKQNK